MPQTGICLVLSSTSIFANLGMTMDQGYHLTNAQQFSLSYGGNHVLGDDPNNSDGREVEEDPWEDEDEPKLRRRGGREVIKQVSHQGKMAV